MESSQLENNSTLSTTQDAPETSFLTIATEDTLDQSILFVNERLQLLGIGSGINFQSNAPSDVATCVNVVYHLMERIRLQKKHLEESRAQVRRQHSECERLNQEKEQLQKQIRMIKEANVHETQRLEKEINELKKARSSLDQQIRELRITTTQAVNRYNLQSVTLKQQLNENSLLRNRLGASLSKQSPSRRVFMTGGEECVTTTVDVQKEFQEMVNDSYEHEAQALREHISELESVIHSNQEIMNTMVNRESEALRNIHSTPIRQVYPRTEDSLIYPTPQMRCVSLFGGGQEVIDFAQSKLEQFEAQLQKIENVDESYSAEKLRGLLREANEVIRDQMTLLQTLSSGNTVEGDALSFLDSDEMAVEDGSH
ncbi:hypothetical protein WA171_002455, partial [Blastocystis sp. BT1]